MHPLADPLRASLPNLYLKSSSFNDNKNTKFHPNLIHASKLYMHLPYPDVIAKCYCYLHKLLSSQRQLWTP